MSNILIVESKNDELFIRALIEHLNLSYVQVDSHPICHIDDFESMEGLNSKKLENRLSALKNQLPKKNMNAIGIIIDHDGKREERINLVNEAIQNIFTAEEHLLDTGKFISAYADVGDDRFDFQIACYLVNVNESGELETVLKAIKSKDSPYADCLGTWRECVEKRLGATSSEEKQKILSDKEFDKFWLNNYIRFDTCSKKEKKRAERKCGIRHFEYVTQSKKDIFDFDNPVLEDIKCFLGLFKNHGSN
ncbi:MAG: hypothetical protein B6245_04110 [Desulfobacteraceae bacterium 4572_88]|nr:MAG: hypothetical protein B6245_04110 [Desulfobacteraceae bacterium 4572_88]